MSRQSLDDKKVFQNFFTKLLYNKPPVESFANLLARDWSKTRREPHELHLNYSKTVQEVLNSACGNLWQNVASSFFPDIQDPIEKWNNHCRFFLKGGKAQYNKMIALGKVASPNLPSGGDDLDGYEIFEEKIDPHMPGPNIAMVLADTLASGHKNSDFDFEFLINGGYDEEEVVERLDAVVAQCARTCENQLKDKLHDYIDALNDYENQKELRDNLRLVLPRLTGE